MKVSSAHSATPKAPRRFPFFSAVLKWFLGLLIVLACLMLVLGLIVRFAVSPDFLERIVISLIEQNSDLSLVLEKTHVSFFPKPVLELYGVKLWNKKETSTAPPILEVPRAACELHLLPLLFKKVELDNVRLEGANIKWTLPIGGANHSKILLIEDVNLSAENVRSGRWIKFSAQGNWLGGSDNVSLRGRMKADFDGWNPDSFSIAADLHVGQLTLADVMKWFEISLAEQIDSGTSDVMIQFSKQEGEADIAAKVNSVFDGLVYHLGMEKTRTSEPARYELNGSASLDFNNRVLSLKESVLTSPVGDLHAQGKIDLVSWKMEDVAISSERIVLDNLPKHFLPIAQIMPLGLGFSGEGKIEFHLGGTLDQLQMGVKMDFTKALLTYSRYFIKSKSIPLEFSAADLVVKSGRELNGGFDVRMDELRMKGAFVDFDLISKMGELTLVTNLISLGGFEQFLPTCAGYQLGGSAKFFLNGKGDFEKPGTLLLMFHTGLKDVSIRSGDHPPLIAGLHGKIDVGPMDLETKDLRFEFGESRLDVRSKMFFHGEKQIIVQVGSPAFDVRKFVLRLEEVMPILGVAPSGMDWTGFETVISQIVPPDGKAENLTVEFQFEQHRLNIQSLAFDIYGGHVAGSGWIDFPPAEKKAEEAPSSETAAQVDTKPTFSFSAEMRGVSLARMLRRDIEKPLEGNLFGAFRVEGKGFTKEDLEANLSGTGSLSVTNGELRTVDILGTLGAIAELAGLGEFASGTTRFHDVRSDFRVAGGKVQTDRLVVYSDDFNIDGSGEIDFGGNLNFRLDTVLSNRLSRAIDSRLKEEDHLGPIPLLLTGKLDAPNLKPDPLLIRDFLANLAVRKLNKVLAQQDWLKKLAPAVEDEVVKEDPSAETPAPIDQNAATIGMTLLESLFQKQD